MLLYFLAGLSLLLMLMLSLAIACIRGKAEEAAIQTIRADNWHKAYGEKAAALEAHRVATDSLISDNYEAIRTRTVTLRAAIADIGALKAEVAILKDQLAQGEDTIKFWRGRFDETTVELDKRSMAFLALKADLKAKIDRLDELNGENASLSYRLDEANSGRLVAEDRCVGFEECRLGFSAMERKLTILKLVLDDETEDLDG